MSNPARYDITTYEGDTFALTLRFEGNVTTQTPKFEINNTSGTSVLELTNGSGISMSYDGGTDKTTINITITAAQTTALDPSIIYSYDFQFTNAGVVTTYIAGSFSLTGEVSV